jgi:hypothetical protein
MAGHDLRRGDALELAVAESQEQMALREEEREEEKRKDAEVAEVGLHGGDAFNG